MQRACSNAPILCWPVPPPGCRQTSLWQTRTRRGIQELYISGCMTLHLFLTHLAVWLALFIAYQLVAFHTPLLMLVLCGYGFFIFMRWLIRYHPYWAVFLISFFRALMGG